MADNEHTLPSLGQAEVLSVQHSVSEPIPERRQPPEEGSKIPPSTRRQDTGYVLPYQPLGPIAISERQIDERQVSARISQSSPKAGDAERLTGCSTNEKIDCCNGPLLKLGHIPEVWYGRIVMREHRRRELVDLR